ncbi:MAG: hypothetical protein JXQ75_18655 [Phycisphaerae bacterium]|nr:hypothetical protein [Phycisphaerae bacterium]
MKTRQLIVGFFSCFAVAATAGIGVEATFAQLSSGDIAALRAQGEEEGWTFTVVENPATAYSLDELCGLVEPEGWRDEAPFDPCTPRDDPPAYFDWRNHSSGGCPPARNQGGCGSCWAFATVGPLECNILIQLGLTVDLSEQWLVSCNSDGWSCGGGWWAHNYHEWKTDPCGGTGSVYEADFPYVAANAMCSCPYPHDFVIDDWAFVGSSGSVPSVSSMKQAILDHGPITVGVRANSAMQAYGGGIFNGCSTGSINHGVVLVGWDNNQGSYGVWFMRNSWGTGWGENGGYMRIPYGCSSIGYAACYVVADLVDDSPPSPDPMTFGAPPQPCTYEPTTEIMMQATPTSDRTPPVTYKFEATLVGHARTPEWGGGTWYFDADLPPNTECGYRVRAKDGQGLMNAFSNWAYTATAIELPEDLVATTITEESIHVQATDTFTNLTEGNSGLYFEVKLDGTPIANSGWIQADHWTAYGLDPETTYTFSVKARNQNSYPPDPVPVVKEFATTGAGSCALMGDVNSDGEVNGLDIPGFVRAKLGQSPIGQENPACAFYGGTLEEETDAFIDDLLDAM